MKNPDCAFLRTSPFHERYSLRQFKVPRRSECLYFSDVFAILDIDNGNVTYGCGHFARQSVSSFPSPSRMLERLCSPSAGKLTAVKIPRAAHRYFIVWDPVPNGKGYAFVPWKERDLARSHRRHWPVIMGVGRRVAKLLCLPNTQFLFITGSLEVQDSSQAPEGPAAEIPSTT